jgi:hypothetical protein
VTVLAAFRSMLVQSTSSVELTYQGAPITSPVRVGRWQVSSDGTRETMRATVEFGPFPTDATFDGATLTTVGGAEPVRFPTRAVLPAGWTFSYDLEMRFVRDG